MRNQDNDKANKELMDLEDKLIELVKELYGVIDDCDAINPRRAASLFEALIASMKERSKLLSENQLKNQYTRNQSNVIKVIFNERFISQSFELLFVVMRQKYCCVD